MNIRKCVVEELWRRVEKMKKRRFGEMDPLEEDRNARKEYREYWI